MTACPNHPACRCPTPCDTDTADRPARLLVRAVTLGLVLVAIVGLGLLAAGALHG